MFDNILGHDSIKKGLLHALSNKRLHHALLFSGRKGIGKSMVALALAQIINCKNSHFNEENEDFCQCGQCKNCKRIASGTHPDVMYNRLEDKSTYSIDRIREIQQQVAYEPFESELRVVIIEDAHCMQEPAANALLKTLEEPSSRTLFILITDQEQRLLPTIISRCQVLRFAAFSNQQVEDFLIQKGTPREEAEWIATLADGSFADALSFLDNNFTKDILSTFEAILSMESESQIFKIAEQMAPKSEAAAKKKEKTENITDENTKTAPKSPKRAKDSAFIALTVLLSTYLRDVLLLKVEKNPHLMLKHREQEMRKRAEKTSIENINRALNILMDAPEALSGNANPTLMCERILLQLRGVFY